MAQNRLRRVFGHHTDEFDIVVIGGGVAGSAATNTAIQAGARVALVEEYRLGGT